VRAGERIATPEAKTSGAPYREQEEPHPGARRYPRAHRQWPGHHLPALLDSRIRHRLHVDCEWCYLKKTLWRIGTHPILYGTEERLQRAVKRWLKRPEPSVLNAGKCDSASDPASRNVLIEDTAPGSCKCAFEIHNCKPKIRLLRIARSLAQDQAFAELTQWTEE
jgi:hypothetical protein